MRDRVLRAARQAGREPGEITCGYHLEIRVDDRAAPRPGLVTGSADAVAVAADRVREAGLHRAEFRAGRAGTAGAGAAARPGGDPAVRAAV